MLQTLETPLAALAVEWDALADDVAAEPWHRPAWASAWWTAFGNGELHLATVWRDGTLVGVAPFAEAHGGLRAAANWHTPSFSLLAADEDARAALCEQLLDERPTWVHVPFLDDAEVAPLRAAGTARRYRSLERTVQRSPYVPTGLGAEEVWRGAGVDPRERLRQIARKRRKLARESEVETCMSEGADDLDRLLDEGFRVESSGWKAERGTAILSSPQTVRFYTEVANDAAARGTLRLFFVRVDGRMASFELCLEENGRLYNLKGGHDPAFRPYTVGFMTHQLMIDHCLAQGLESFEFLGSDDPHKREWTQLVRERRLVQLFRPTPRGAAVHAAYAYGRPAAKWLLRRGR